METKHTQGPWEVREDDWGVHVVAPAASSPGCDEYPIADNVNGDSRATPRLATPLQNARLIAAAPDLLAALKDLVDCEHTTAAMWRQARIAIAKAITPAAQESEP